MSKSYAIIPSETLGDILDTYESRTEAERGLRTRPAGTYTIIRLIEVDAQVKLPDPTPLQNVVVPGKRLVERVRKPKAAKE